MIHDDILKQQVNVLTCLEHWAAELPEVMIVYNLFCDLVHPNIGSNFLVAATSDNRMYFSQSKGAPVGRQIFEQSFIMLISCSHKPFGDF